MVKIRCNEIKKILVLLCSASVGEVPWFRFIIVKTKPIKQTLHSHTALPQQTILVMLGVSSQSVGSPVCPHIQDQLVWNSREYQVTYSGSVSGVVSFGSFTGLPSSWLVILSSSVLISTIGSFDPSFLKVIKRVLVYYHPINCIHCT